MKAILMAAGMGTRISTKTNEPKSLLRVGNVPLLVHTVEMLIAHDISVCICLGFKGEKIREALKQYPVTFYENPFYKVTNSIASLWFARQELECDDDLLFANADVFWQEDILCPLMMKQEEVTLLADSSRKECGDYFFECQGDRLIAYGKELKLHQRTSEYVGIAKISKSFVPIFKERLVQLVKEGDYQLWWENTLYSMIDERKIQVEDISGLYWSEIDTLADYESILNYIDQK